MKIELALDKASRCPCCGDRWPMLCDSGIGDSPWVVMCVVCKCNSGTHATQERALEVWNQRNDSTIASLELQLVALRHMIDNRQTWEDVLVPNGQNIH